MNRRPRRGDTEAREVERSWIIDHGDHPRINGELGWVGPDSGRDGKEAPLRELALEPHEE